MLYSLAREDAESHDCRPKPAILRLLVRYGARQSVLPVNDLALAANSANDEPDRSLWWLSARIETSCPSAALRSAPTVACSREMWLNGSNEYQRIAFSWVILLISSSGTLFSESTSHSSSGAPGHIESLWG